MASGSAVQLVTLQPAQIVAASSPTSGGSPTALAPGNNASISTTPPAASSAQQPAAATVAATATTTPAPAPPARSSHTLPAWAQNVKTVLKTCSSAIKFAIAVLGVWAVCIAWQGLKLQRWTASNHALQSCQALESRSEYCNRTMDAGVRPPPSWKRDIAAMTDWNILVVSVNGALWGRPLLDAAAIVMTVAAILFATILIRPRLVLFPPLVSNVRLLPVDFTGGQIYLHTFRWVRTSWLASGPWLEILRSLADAVFIGVILDDNNTYELAKYGKRIGVCYESDDEEHIDDDGHVLDDESIDDDDHRQSDEQINNIEHLNAGTSNQPKYPALTISELLPLDESFRMLLDYRVDKWRAPSDPDRIGLMPLHINDRKKSMIKRLEEKNLFHFLDCLLGPERLFDDLPLSLTRILVRLDFEPGDRSYGVPLAAFLPNNARRRQCILLDVLEELFERRESEHYLRHERIEIEDLRQQANDSGFAGAALKDALLKLYSTSALGALETAPSLDPSVRQSVSLWLEQATVSGKQPLAKNVHPNPPPIATRKPVTREPRRERRRWPGKSLLSSGKGLFK